MGKDSGIGIGRIEEGLSSIHKCYVESVKAIGYSTKQKRGIFFIEDMEKNKNSAELISEKAMEIINSSYMNPEISLVSVSKDSCKSELSERFDKEIHRSDLYRYSDPEKNRCCERYASSFGL